MLLGRNISTDIKCLSTCVFASLILFCAGCAQQDKNIADLNPEDLTASAKLIIADGLSDPDPRIRVNAIEAAVQTHQEQLMSKIQLMLVDDFVPVRFAAAVAVGDAEYYSAKPTLKRLLENADENTKLAAAYGLYKMGQKENITILKDALNSEDPVSCANAATLLGKAGDKSAIPLLYKVMADTEADDKAVFQAAMARAMLGDEEVVQRIWAMLISGYAEDRVIGVQSMGALGTRHAEEALVTMLEDELIEVRLAAAGELGHLGNKIGEQTVKNLFEQHAWAQADDESAARIEILASLAIGKIASESLKPYLADLIQSKSKNVKLAAAQAVLMFDEI